ncbi:MAG: hypothetical protein J5831_04080 [Bacteroidales bacterium]|nr:hypothetical protein [Bacteroidales bacterium]
MKRESRKTASKGSRTIMSILGGSFLTKEDFSKMFPFLVYLTILLMLIITNAYVAESTSRSIKKNTVRLRDLRVEYIYAKSAFTRESTQKILIEKLSGDGLKESLETRVVNKMEDRRQKTEDGRQNNF